MKSKMLLVLYAGHPQPTAEQDLVATLEHSNPSVFRRDVLRRAHKDALVHYDTGDRLVFLSPLGVREVEENIPLEI